MYIIGHRGARGLAAENTLAGIERALNVGVDWIEFDVRRTADGKLAVIHDAHTGRIAKEKLSVRHSSYAQLASVHPHSGERIPQLHETVALIGKRAKINIEIKSLGCEKGVVQLIQASVKEGYAYDHFMVSSFYPHILAAIHREEPQVPLALLEFHLPLSRLLARGLSLKAVGMHHTTISQLAVRLAKRRGLLVYAYTVNNPLEAKRLAAMGVDGVVTDYPDQIKAAMDSNITL